MPAEISSSLQALFATLPFWPLLAAIGIGILLATNKGLKYAHWLTVGGVGISAVLAVTLYLNIAPIATKYAHHAEASEHAAAEHVPAALVAQEHAETTPAAESSHAEPAGETAHGEEEHATEGGHAAYAIDTYTLGHWFSLGIFTGPDGEEYTRWVDFNFAVDGLTATMLLFVCLVSFMVVIYAVGYMKDHHGHPEVGYQRFFAWLGLFVFSMGMLVLSGNFVLLYLGWEAVGLCSYLLIGFYYKKPEAAAAAKKAFIVNRIGDFGFALGIFTIYMVLKDHVQPGENVLDYATVFKYASYIASQQIAGINAASVISLLLFCGAIGKSAQFPLYVWLPDAMEGPTPVSALIHAATMVTAGVYMTARCGPLFMNADPYVLEIVMWVGVIGAMLAATMAMAQYDMKRILAYSTISQLAYMFVALGAHAPTSAVFHVFTHAFFKALLFMTAGSVMHAMGGIIDVRHFSGLRKVLPTTYKQMLIGCLALSGFPLLAGFWSKDEIVHAAMVHSPIVGWLMIVTAGLTAYYTFRMFFLCFYGEERWPKEAGEHPHEMPGIMTNPLWVLSLGAIFAGYLGVTILPSGSLSFLGFLNPHGFFHDVLAGSTIVSGEHHTGDIWVAYVSSVVALAGIGLAYMRYGTAPQEDPDAKLLGPAFTLLYNKYYVDEIYAAVFVQPLRKLGDFFFGVDRFGINGIIKAVTVVLRGLSFLLSLFQRGALAGYALTMVLGTALILVVWRWSA